MYKSRLFLAAVAALASAQGYPDNTAAWVWSVTDFAGGCSPAACTFAFNITAEDFNTYFKGFAAQCEGNTLQNGGNYVICDQSDANKVVEAKIGDLVTVDGEQKIQTFVSYTYRAPILPNIQVAYNFTGVGAGRYAQLDPNATDEFRIEPNDVTFEKIV